MFGENRTVDVAENVTLTVTSAAGIVNVRELLEPRTVISAPVSFLVTLTVPIAKFALGIICDMYTSLPATALSGTMNEPFTGSVFIIARGSIGFCVHLAQ